ncbi:MAG TPA: phage holin family protein [Nocardioidaceae bacterium]|jgi:hypothetical protein|nr:phage holin family protein [Nocardioidaceae bacterium]
MSTQAPQIDERGRSKHTLTPIDDEPTIGRLVADASRDISSLLHNEIALAKSELKVSVKAGGTGAGMFAGAAFFALLGVVMLSIGIALLINFSGLALAYCFLIVFGGYLGFAGLLGLIGIRMVRKVKPPERAIHQAQETSQILKRK